MNGEVIETTEIVSPTEEIVNTDGTQELESNETNEELNLEQQAEQRLEQEQQDVEEKKSFLDGLREKILGRGKPVVEEEKPAISTEFLEVAEQAGFTTDQINQLAEDYSPEELKELTELLLEFDDEEEEEAEEETNKTVAKEEPKELVLTEEIKEELKPFIEQIQKAYEEKLKESLVPLEDVKSRLVQQEAEKAYREAYDNQCYADELFDAISKDFPVFGQTKELMVYPEDHPKAGELVPMGQTYKARATVYDKAVSYQDKLGLSWKDAMDEAVSWYKGKYGEQEVQKKVVKNLKKNEKRLSPKRTSKETTQVFASEHEMKLAAIAEAKRKAGIA